MTVSLALVTVGPAIDSIRTLFGEYQRAIDTDLCFQSFTAELAGLPGDYAPPSGRLYLAEIDGRAAGCVALRAVGDGRGEMKRLFVRPDARGAGVGLALVRQVLADARALGYTAVVLDTLPVMADAQRMYERLGFVDIPPYRANPVPGARYLGLDLTAAPS